MLNSYVRAKATLHPRFAQTYGKLQWYCLDFWARELGLDTGILDSAKTYGIAELLAIRHPDSQKGPWDTGLYNAVEDFRELYIHDRVTK
ncbi:hypothetical protein [Endozoicomonas sp. SCSIO W0465]|uniref:hypothetical protein n=1 Tax=Endozoicomonas sp. SCSIO W0465 TaxID=2918516 RepID=UPI0020753D06|nr:hypothetical protein [Endozoicomonas sp. SCSIO W0465]USE35827.1 hypothetical protein MJO57_27805 [Endozoicomonas sp. SCSIO W0465]